MNKPKLNQPDVNQNTTIPVIDQQEIVDFKQNNVELNLNKYGLIKIEPGVITYNGKIYVAIDSLDPTIEEVKKEWEDDDYIWEEDEFDIKLIAKKPTYYLKIRIFKNSKTYQGTIDFKLHIRLTKTFRALGWKV